jgi:glycine betaine transporter
MCPGLAHLPPKLPALATGTEDVWCLFLIYLCFSRFAKIKLGKDDEKPRYSDFTWCARWSSLTFTQTQTQTQTQTRFAMLFTCGVAVGLYVFGVAEPLYASSSKLCTCTCPSPCPCG